MDSPTDEQLTAEDIEAAYERALMAMDAVEDAVESLSHSVEDDTHGDRRTDQVAESGESEPETDDGGAILSSEEMLQSREIIEAALFVGGASLTTRRLGQMLGSVDATERIAADIDKLNAIYQAESRPYRVEFGEGGYRLSLLPEFESVRDAVFGAGPKEVRLSQDALEVLAFVAYRQPASREELEDAGKENAAAVLRQLLRRELLSLQRRDDDQVVYATTDRFLELFGLRSIDDLPLPEDVELK